MRRAEDGEDWGYAPRDGWEVGVETFIMGITIGIAFVVIVILSIIGFIIDATEYLMGCGVLLITGIIVTGCIVATM